MIVDGRVGWVGGAGIEDYFHDGRFHDLFVRATGPVVSRCSSSFSPASAGSGLGSSDELDGLFPSSEAGADAVPAVILHNAPRQVPADHRRDRAFARAARETLDVVNPYVTDRGMIEIEHAARRGVRVRLFVPANANNWACAAAQQFHHAKLLGAGVDILEYPAMLHAKLSCPMERSFSSGRAISRPGA